jgi:hypothetical protein
MRYVLDSKVEPSGWTQVGDRISRYHLLDLSARYIDQAVTRAWQERDKRPWRETAMRDRTKRLCQESNRIDKSTKISVSTTPESRWDANQREQEYSPGWIRLSLPYFLTQKHALLQGVWWELFYLTRITTLDSKRSASSLKQSIHFL